MAHMAHLCSKENNDGCTRRELCSLQQYRRCHLRLSAEGSGDLKISVESRESLSHNILARISNEPTAKWFGARGAVYELSVVHLNLRKTLQLIVYLILDSS